MDENDLKKAEDMYGYGIEFHLEENGRLYVAVDGYITRDEKDAGKRSMYFNGCWIHYNKKGYIRELAAIVNAINGQAACEVQ